MKRFFTILAALLIATGVWAQHELLQKYTEMADVNTTFVTKGRLSQIPLAQLSVPGLDEMVSKIENLTFLVSRGDKMGKTMSTKLPRQLSHRGFETKVFQRQNGKDVTIMQSGTDPRQVVIILYDKPKTIVVSIVGNFEDVG